MFTSILLAYLQLSVSIDVEEGEKEIQLTPYYKLVFHSLIVGIVTAIIYIIFSPKDLYLKLFQQVVFFSYAF